VLFHPFGKLILATAVELQGGNDILHKTSLIDNVPFAIGVGIYFPIFLGIQGNGAAGSAVFSGSTKNIGLMDECQNIGKWKIVFSNLFTLRGSKPSQGCLDDARIQFVANLEFLLHSIIGSDGGILIGLWTSTNGSFRSFRTRSLGFVGSCIHLCNIISEIKRL